jgi:uncharacterized membrane protein
MLEFNHHDVHRPDEVFLEIIMRPSVMTQLSSVRWILGGIAFVCLALGMTFWSIGAGPVLPFMGIEIALLYAAYRFGVNHGQKIEVLSLSENDLIVRKRGQNKKNNEAIRLQPYWANLELEREHGRHMRLHLRSKGYSIEIGELLAPAERQQLASVLDVELGKLKGVT